MAKKKVYGVFDTETIGIDNKWIYDLGLVVIEKTGKILYKKRWIIKEVIEIPNIEKIAFYGSKIPLFYKGLPVVPFKQAKEEFNQILEEMEVTTITAYNLQFDMGAIKDTLQFTNTGKKFLKKSYEYFDLWNATCDSIFQQKRFKRVAIEENWLTEKGNIRSSAEIAYMYITGNYQFMEEHTALEDSEIEAEILQKVLKQKKKITRNTIISNPWRKIQFKVKKEFTEKQLTAYYQNIVLMGCSPHPADIKLKENQSLIINSGYGKRY